MFHTHRHFTVDFPKGPLGVGNDYVREVARLKRGKATLRILTKTECIRDRLDAAVAVAEWTEREDPALVPKLEESERRLNAS